MIDLLRSPWLPWALLAFVFVVAAVQCLYLWAVLADREEWRQLAIDAADGEGRAIILTGHAVVAARAHAFQAPPRPPLDPWVPVITVRPRMLTRSEHRPL